MTELSFGFGDKIPEIKCHFHHLKRTYSHFDVAIDANCDKLFDVLVCQIYMSIERVVLWIDEL